PTRSPLHGSHPSPNGGGIEHAAPSIPGSDHFLIPPLSGEGRREAPGWGQRRKYDARDSNTDSKTPPPPRRFPARIPPPTGEGTELSRSFFINLRGLY